MTEEKNEKCCYKLSATVVTDSSLHIGNGKRTGVIKHTLPFIPGSMIRGSIGNCLLRISGEKGSELYDLLFAEESGKSSEIFFKQCYPLHLKCGGNNNGIFFPSPKTLFKCQNRQCGRLYETYEPPLQCESCGKSVKPFLGYRCSNCGELSSSPVSMRRISSSAIDRANNSAALLATETGATTSVSNRPSSFALDYSDADGTFLSPGKAQTEEQERHGLLHTIDVIEKGTRFGFDVILASSCGRFMDSIISLLTRAVEDEGFGGSKSRGFGKISVQDTRVEEITTELIEKRAESIYRNPRFSVYLLSPMVIEDTHRSLEPSAILEAARRAYSWCFKEGKPSLPELKKLKQIFSYEVFGGWSLKENKQRKSAVSISSGSSFQFEYSSPTNDAILRLGKALASLEYYALGGYKPHGYGQIKIASV